MPDRGQRAKPAPKGRVRVGLSGWAYIDWAGRFFPPEVRAGDRLAFVARLFDTVEVNRSFYSLLRPEVYRGWRDTVPDDFVFAVKGSRFITHMKRLRDVETALANFFASGVLDLGTKLGPILWQLPSNWTPEIDRLETFLNLLPMSSRSAALIASKHDERVANPRIPPGPDRSVRHVLEIRSEDRPDSPVADLAARHHVAVAHSHSTAWPYREEMTADFSYLRLHGPGRLYASGYSEADLEHWRDQIEEWQAGAGHRPHDVYVYFDNDGSAHAPRDASSLLSLLGESARVGCNHPA